ncbi:hypothetical protein HDU76_009096, partial [Blyttiomyces sp. JEL0837]
MYLFNKISALLAAQNTVNSTSSPIQQSTNVTTTTYCQTATLIDGDGCHQFAIKNGITVDQLKSFNPSLTCHPHISAKAGDPLCISEGELVCPQTLPAGNSDGSCVYYDVPGNSTTGNVAASANLTLAQLIYANPNAGCSPLLPYTRLCLTDGKRPSTARKQLDN